MTKQQYNSLAPYQKEVYDKCNKANKGALFVAWGITAVLTVVCFIAGITQSDPLGGLGVGVVLGVTFGSLISGIAHFGFIFKKIGFGNTILLWIVLGIFILMLYGFILLFVWYAGMVCVVVDTILFIMKKPLIYRWEDKRVLAKAETQTGAYITEPSAADKLSELTQMLNNGLITQEDFDAKKAEIMSKM